jgi:hypothetical protein
MADKKTIEEDIKKAYNYWVQTNIPLILGYRDY